MKTIRVIFRSLCRFSREILFPNNLYKLRITFPQFRKRLHHYLLALYEESLSSKHNRFIDVSFQLDSQKQISHRHAQQTKTTLQPNRNRTSPPWSGMDHLWSFRLGLATNTGMCTVTVVTGECDIEPYGFDMSVQFVRVLGLSFDIVSPARGVATG